MVLSKQGRKLYHVEGDGNCFFRALSYIIHKTEDHHASVRATLVLFTELNTKCFEQYCTTDSVKDHIQHMRHERVWATQLEAYVAASCLRRTVYIYSQRSGNGERYWQKIDPLPPHTLMSLPTEYKIELHPFITHLELCHINWCHYDVITPLNGEYPEPPHIPSNISYFELD